MHQINGKENNLQRSYCNKVCFCIDITCAYMQLNIQKDNG
jgi:hypothetical protein